MNTNIEEFYAGLENAYTSGQPAEAESYLLDQLKGSAHGCAMCFNPLEITVCNELGSFYRGMGDFKKSANFFEMAAKQISAHLGEQTVEYATVLNNLAGTCRLAGEYEKAVAYFHRSALIYSTQIGTENAYYCSILNNIALVYQNMKQYDRAKEYLSDALRISKSLPGSEMDVAITYSNLGALHLDMNEYDTAEEALKESIRIYETLETSKQVHLAAVYNSLGTLALKSGKPQEAIKHYNKALELTLWHFGENHEYQILLKHMERAKEALAQDSNKRDSDK